MAQSSSLFLVKNDVALKYGAALVWEIDRELNLDFQGTKLSFFLLKIETTIDGIERCNPLSSCYVEYVSYHLHINCTP